MSSKIPFLKGKREWGGAFLLLVLIFGINLWLRFEAFKDYISQDRQSLQARVLAQYEKNNKWVLKLKTDSGLLLYSTSKEDLKDLQNRWVRVFGKPAKCTFNQSFKSCFFITFSIDVLPKDWRNRFYAYIDSQHSTPLISQFYQTLFFASNLPKEWRDLSSLLKISHLLAISGLHLGILAFVIFAFFSPLYRFFQSRFFPYRNRLFDLGGLVVFFLLGYLFLLDFPPSFLRAYVMSLMAFLFTLCHFSLLNFSFLFLCACLIIALFPEFIVSLGFWFSVLGVFYIFLFLKYWRFEWIKSHWIRYLLIICALNSVLFFNMLPLTHLFFPSFSLVSFLAIPLSILFAPFFVLVMVLHLFGFGGILDGILEEVLSYKFNFQNIFTPLWFAICYAILSLWAIKSRFAYILSLILCILFYLFLMAKTL